MILPDLLVVEAPVVEHFDLICLAQEGVTRHLLDETFVRPTQDMLAQDMPELCIHLDEFVETIATLVFHYFPFFAIRRIWSPETPRRSRSTPHGESRLRVRHRDAKLAPRGRNH